MFMCSTLLAFLETVPCCKCVYDMNFAITAASEGILVVLCV